MPSRPYDERTCIIVVNLDGKSVGLVVDEVSEVLDIPNEQIEPAPKSGKGQNRYIQGMGKVGEEVKILLDISRLLFDEEWEQLDAVAQG